MFSLPNLAPQNIALLSLGLAVTAVIPVVNLAPGVVAAPTSQLSFPDIQDHWASPFIEPLAEKNIVAGYLDGTFRPNQLVQRDEFAAIIRQAFNQEPVQKIASGSVYKDVPADYWAAPAIEEAYQTGFMAGYPGGFFRPNQEISRVEALVALEKNLNVSSTSPTPSATQMKMNQPTAQATTQPVSRDRATKKRFLMPLAMTTLMQPLITAPVKSQITDANSSPSSVASDPETFPKGSPSSVATESSLPVTSPASFTVSNYYVDAQEIPHYAVTNVAAATKANIVVNYPNQEILNPNQPATRGEIAAFIYQALVAQGKIEPLPSSVEASNYIVNRTTSSNQNTQTVQ
ncbi:MAG TPA: S-layer homology domain-containing protein [Cyanobacteria bacterium UBA8803]|nr:S-layer homology domain-containing protein [Cyanobacteria bacterium UBA9273]HBL59743.1 S-layer homology domain-containing protein [Cyanobacteria bacterium UBA8803]